MTDNKNKKVGLGLERTVQWCVSNINNIYDTSEILSKFGIRVVDNVPTTEDLPDPATYPGDFGDAILVGTEPPYDYYIWTRPFSPDVRGEWFNIGQFPLPGKQGEQGEQGLPGNPGTRGNIWITGEGTPTLTEINGEDVIVGDLYLDTITSWVYRYSGEENGWLYITNIKGETGEGEQGIPGPAGPIVDIIGTLTSINQLPQTAEEIAAFVEEYGRQGAYLIGANGSTKNVYGLVGPDNDLRWDNLGLFATGTIVYTGGTPKETVNLDDWVKRLNPNEPNNRYVYTTRRDSNGARIELRKVTANTFAADTFPWRDGNGSIKVPTPLAGWDGNSAANKAYVDNAVSSYHNKQILTYTDRTSNWTYYMRANMSFKIAVQATLDSDTAAAKIGSVVLPDGVVYIAGETYTIDNGMGVFYEYKLKDGTTSIGNYAIISKTSTLSIMDMSGPVNITAIISNA